jgi:hypothetical protein
MSPEMRSEEEIDEQIKIGYEAIIQMKEHNYANPAIITIKTTIQTLLWVLGYELDEITELMNRNELGGELFEL